jgi:nicotinate-nucleotide pyrophosphorylase (carboxylating)
MSQRFLPSLPLSEWTDSLRRGLDEDDASWDFTTQAALRASRKSTIRAEIVAKSSGVFVGVPLLRAAERVAEDWGEHFLAQPKVKEGARVRAGQVVAVWSGSPRALLALERPYLNLASFLSGTATATREWREHISSYHPRIRLCPTRKTLPGFRSLSIYAACVGGAHPHRMGLSGGVLLKENHLRLAGSIARAIESARETAPHGLKIEIEVTSLTELKQACASGADVVMLDNFTPQEVLQATRWLKTSKQRPVIEVSGGLTLQNVDRYLVEGVDVVSVGALTHSVRPLDLSLLVRK